MKKLLEELDKFADSQQIELSKWVRELLYEFLTELLFDVRDAQKQ